VLEVQGTQAQRGLASPRNKNQRWLFFDYKCAPLHVEVERQQPVDRRGKIAIENLERVSQQAHKLELLRWE